MRNTYSASRWACKGQALPAAAQRAKWHGVKREDKNMTNTMEQQKLVAVNTSIRLDKYLSKVWTNDGQAGAVETAKEVAVKIGAYLASMHTGQSKLTASLREEAEKLIVTFCDSEQSEKVRAELKEAVDAINSLHNSQAAAEKAAKQAEKDRQAAEKQAAREADKAEKEAAKKLKNELAAQKKLEASQDWDAIIAWRPEGRAQVSLRTMQANIITGDYYLHYPDIDEAYKVSDISSKSVYLLSHYLADGTPMYWEMAISQFDESSGLVTNKSGAQTAYRFYVG